MRNYSKSKSIRSESSLCLRLEGVPSSELSLSDTPVAVVDRPVPELKPGLLSEPEVVVLVVEGDPEKDWLDRRVEPPSSKINCHSKTEKYFSKICTKVKIPVTPCSMIMDFCLNKFWPKLYSWLKYDWLERKGEQTAFGSLNLRSKELKCLIMKQKKPCIYNFFDFLIVKNEQNLRVGFTR